MEGNLDLVSILFKFMNPSLLVLIICYVAMVKKMTKNLLDDNSKDVLYPLTCIGLGVFFGYFVTSSQDIMICMTIGLAGGGVMAVKNWIKSIKNRNNTPR